MAGKHRKPVAHRFGATHIAAAFAAGAVLFGGGTALAATSLSGPARAQSDLTQIVALAQDAQSALASPTPTISPTPTVSPSPTPSRSRRPGRSPSPTPSSASPSPTTPAGNGCLTRLAACGFPAASNTGAKGALTVHSGNLSASGTIKDLDIKGCLTITGNATVTDVLIEGCGGSARSLDIRAGGTVTVTDTTVRASSSQPSAVVIDHGTTTLTRLDVSGGNDGIDITSGVVTLTDSYVHDILRASGSHNDAVQVLAGTAISLTHDTLLAYNAAQDDPMNACLQVGEIAPGKTLGTLTLSGGICDGGNYSINANGGNGGGTITVTGERFGTDYRYGVQANLDAPFTTVWSGNVDDATGHTV